MSEIQTQKSEALSLYNLGWSTHKIGRKFARNGKTIWFWLKSLDAVIRTRSDAGKRRIFSIETRRRMSESGKIKVISIEHRRKITESCRGREISQNTRQKISEAQRGEKGNSWKGANASIGAGHVRCEKMYPADKCENCGDINKENKNLHRHHRDKNTLNNAPENIQILCASCHLRLHAKQRREICHVS